MSMWDDYDQDRPVEATCKYCGKEDLEWEHDGDVWVLMEPHCRVHKCDEKALRKAALDDFEGL